MTLIASVFLQAWQFSAVAEAKDEAECSRFYSRVFSGFLSVIMIGASGLILCCRFLTGLLLNIDYFEAWRYMPTLLCASALEAVVSFLASVYLVRKKSSHSFFTALLGAGGNILLNLLLIPRMGPLGAAVATLASYALVMVVRLIDAPRFIRFHRCLPRLCAGGALLLALAAVMTLDVGGRIWWALGLTALNVAINVPALLSGVRQIIARRK